MIENALPSSTASLSRFIAPVIERAWTRGSREKPAIVPSIEPGRTSLTTTSRVPVAMSCTSASLPSPADTPLPPAPSTNRPSTTSRLPDSSSASRPQATNDEPATVTEQK